MKVCKVNTLGLLLLLTVVVLLLPATGLAQQEGFFAVSQGETQYQVTPLENSTSAADFYGYVGSTASTGFEVANTAVLFLYENTVTGELSLFVLLGGGSGTEGSVSMTLSGVPTGAAFQVKDDTSDFRDTWSLTAPTGSVSWAWSTGLGDGMVLGPLGDEFELSLFPQFTSGISQVKLLYGSLAAPAAVELNLIDPIIISATPNQPPVAAFYMSPVSAHINDTITFDASSSYDPDGSVVSYEWDFNGDGLFEQTTSDPTATYTYSAAGLKSITLRVTDDEGGTDRISQTVAIDELAVSVSRTISTIQALPGTTFLVVIRIEPEMDLAGVGLQENLPIGWKVEPLENAGAAFKRDDVQWVFLEQIKAGTTKVISYEVTVPDSNQLIATTLPVCFTISGILQSMSPAFDMEVEGDSMIEITDALRLKTAIAHLVPGDGGDIEDRIDLRLSQKISSQQLTRAIQMWQNQESVPWTQGATIDLYDMKELSAYAYTCTPVDLELPLVSEATIYAVRTISTPVPCNNVLLNYYGPGGNKAASTFTVKVEIWSDQDLYGVGLEEDLPTGWRVVTVQNDGFYYKPSAVEWVFPTKLAAGNTKTIIYQVEVPQTEAIEIAASDPCYASSNDIYGIVDCALPCMERVVTGDSGVDISDCVSVLVAISRWDVENDELDITLSDKISFQQVQRAIAFWLEDEVVPWTCGQTVDYHTLKTIIAYWLTGTTICDPLPGEPYGPCDPDTWLCEEE